MGFLNTLNSNDLYKIEAGVAIIRDRFTGVYGSIIRDDIFRVLAESGTLIFYPLNENKVWGFYIRRRNRNYFILNSSIELEKQVFAAAHELAHTLPFATASWEVLTPTSMYEYVDNGIDVELKKEEILANRFAAELLVNNEDLKSEYIKAPKFYSIETKVVHLADLFLVPYRTIAKRLFEVKLITQNELDKLLSVIPEEVEIISGKYNYRTMNKKITETKDLGNYTRKAVILYENDLSDYTMLEERLELVGENPEMFDIFEELDIFDLYGEDD